MKNLICLLTIMALGTAFFAQAPTEKNTIHIKMNKDVNGVVTEIDTVIHLDNMEDAKEALKGLGMDTDIDIHGDAKGVKMMRIEIETDEEHDGDIKTWIHKGGNGMEGKDMKVIKLKDGNLREMLENMEGISDEEKAQMIEALEKAHGDDAEDKHHKVKVIRLEDKDVDIRVDGEDGEGHHVIMFKGDKGDINLDDIDVDDIMTVDVRGVEEGEGKDVRIVKEVRIVIRLTDVDETDKAALKRAGAPVAPSIEKSLQLDDLAFYPNPNDGKFRLRFNAPDEGNVSVRIVNMDGRVLHQEDLAGFSGSYDEVISIENQASGAYLLSISQNGKTVNKKLVKQ